MRLSFLVAILSISSLSCLASVSSGQQSELHTKAQSYLEKVTNDTTSGIVMLVARDGNVLLQTAGGMADLEGKIPATPETKFRIGSVSKQFTAMAILRLAEQGKLSLQDPLAKYYPEFPNAQSITLENLLTHTSGLHSYTDKPDFLGRVSQVASPTDIIKFSQTDAADFQPGEKYRYCNTGYFLLGEIVAQVSGKSYAEYLKTEFFQPLGMKDSGVYVNSSAPEKMAKGYSVVEEKQFDPCLDWDMSWAGGAGALYSTVGDLHLWNEALFSGKVVNEESLKKTTTPFVLPAGASASNYGYGLMMSEYRRIPLISHSGGLNGWLADLAYFPEQKCTIVVLVNAHPAPPEFAPQAISRKLADTVLAEEIKAMPALEVDASIDPQSYPEYLGKFDYQGSVMEVTVEDNRIFAQLTGQEKFEIFPSAKDQFFFKIVDAQISFQRDEQGEIQGVQHSQNGATFVAPKITGLELTEEQLEPFVGRYRYGIAVMTATREGRQLYAQLTGQPKLPIFPVNENTFEWRVVEAKVEFIKNEKGEVTGARHTQNGSTFDAARIKGREKR